MARKRCGACDARKRSGVRQSDALVKLLLSKFRDGFRTAFMSTPLCPICDKPLELETSKTDENGRAVHEHCYIQQLLASRIESTDPQHPK
jgi:hypothetical protein